MRRALGSLFDARDDDDVHEEPPMPWEDDSFFDVDTWWELQQRDHVYAEERERREDPPEPVPSTVKQKVKTNLIRSDRAGTGSSLTPAEWLVVCWAFGQSCAYCEAEDVQLVLEHVTPICRGGGTTLDNVVPACAKCNSSKGKRDPTQWLGERAQEFLARHADAQYRIALARRRKAAS